MYGHTFLKKFHKLLHAHNGEVAVQVWNGLLGVHKCCKHGCMRVHMSVEAGVRGEEGCRTNKREEKHEA